MPLNIKDETAHRQARELAELTGTSITAAVRAAIEEKLAAARAEAARKARNPEALLDIARQCAERLRGSGLTSDHGMLYDESGLPR